jgi:hypothetical protein
MNHYEERKSRLLDLATQENEIETPLYPPHCNAVRTKMFTTCKRCGKPNNNGYQYCTDCHKRYRRPVTRRKGARS